MSTLLHVEALDRCRFDPMVVIHQDGPLADHLRDRGIPYRLVPLPTYAGRTPSILSIAVAMLRTAPRLARFMRQESIDIAHGNDFRANLTWGAASKLAGRRFVWHQRSLPFSSSVLWKSIGLIADHVVCISQAVRDALPKFKRMPVSVVFNPFEASDGFVSRASARQALLDELGVESDTRIIGLVGRITEQKRPRVFLQAAALMTAESRGPLAFVFAGSGNAAEVDDLRAFARDLGIADSTHFLGFRHPVEACLAGLDLLVAPAHGDGFGRTLVESMLVGTPVIASRSGGHVEIVDDGRTGILVTLDDPKAFASAADRILSDEVFAKEIAERAKQFATERFSVAAHKCQMTNIYESLVTGETRSPC